jgi:hypothetical protein
MAVALLFINTFAYFVGSLIAAGVNRLAKRELLPRRVMGALVVVCVTAFYLVVTLQAIAGAKGLDRLPDFDRSRIKSQAISEAVLPGILVLVPVGIMGWRQRRRANAASNKSSNTDAQNARAG